MELRGTRSRMTLNKLDKKKKDSERVDVGLKNFEKKTWVFFCA